MNHLNIRSHFLRSFLFLLFIVLLASWSGRPTAVYAANFTVNSTGDLGDATPGDGICATEGFDCTHNLRIMAEILRTQQQPDEAHNHFEQSYQVLTQAGDMYESTKTQLALARSNACRSLGRNRDDV